MQARSFVFALHRAGVRIKIVPGSEVEPGVDDCDTALLKLMESTPVIPPVTAIISHVPHRFWLTFPFPEGRMRILSTTFDSSAQGNLPPAEWIEVCNEMDQIWLMTEKEREVFISAGIPPAKIKTLLVPHLWVDNPALPPISREVLPPLKRFRFLCIAMFLPRRRWDALIEAYLEEFRGNDNVELYLKANYPSWHPVPGKPEQDLLNLIASLRRKTGSDASIVLDNDLGTRMGIVHLIDSCNVYISTDTAHTATVGEAIVRERLTIFPSGLGLELPATCYIPIPADPLAKTPLSPEMLLYQPHHGDTLMPRLAVTDVRNAIRRAYEMPAEERHAVAAVAASYMYTPTLAVPATVGAILDGWRYKASVDEEKSAKPAARIVWEVLRPDARAPANWELCLNLIDAGLDLSIIPSPSDTIDSAKEPRLETIARRIRKPLPGTTDIHVRQQWPPNFTPPTEGHWVMIQPWEYGRLPESWVPPMTELADEVWVPSKHVLKTCIASGIPADRVTVIPNGINPDRFHPIDRDSSSGSQKFRFLLVGGTPWQKGIDILLRAFSSEFARSEDVVLIIKDFSAQSRFEDQGPSRMIEDIQKQGRSPEIIHYTERLDSARMPALYQTCDCLVHPYRCEAFGLPVLEAMACGIPVITTAGGATDDFCPPEYTYLIPSTRREFHPRDMLLVGAGGWVLEPDGNALKALMREVFENRQEARRKALQASELARSRMNWKIIAGKVIERIAAITEQPIRRYNR